MMSGTDRAPAPPAPPSAAAAPPPALPQSIPWLGLLAVLMGTFISTLNTRLSTFGLADIRGAVHAGFDEGAWITTAQTVAQMLVAPIAVWAGGIFGPRVVLERAAFLFAGVALVTPFAPDLPTLLALQFAGGAASGFFVPLTLSFVLRNTPPRYWAYGVALYALNLELSVNISASLEGWHVDAHSWHWIYWQNVPLALIMGLCLRYGVKAIPHVPTRLDVDTFGLLSAGVGMALIYAGLDQGNRLDWLNSGLVVALLASGGVLVAGFVINERRVRTPFVNLDFLFTRPILLQLLLVAFLRLTLLATAVLIPQYLQTVRGYRALEVGDTLIWIAAPQLIICPLAAVMLRRFDARYVASVGFVLISLACLSVAGALTPLWGSEQFLPSQLLQAVGQSLALSGVVFFGVLHLRPAEAISFGAALQTARLLGGQCGLAFITTLARLREQSASNTIGLHVQVGDGAVLERLRHYAAVAGRHGGDAVLAARRGAALLGSAVRQAAATQSIIDGFVAVGALTAVALLVALAHQPAPEGPASPRPPRWRLPSQTGGEGTP